MTISNKHYYNASLFKTELDRIFAPGWQFVALTDELANNRDFVCVDLPDDSIVVQNFNGQLKAFQNVCTHRLNLIQTADRGNRHLMCGYHGWMFDAEGRPLGNRGRHGPTDCFESRERICLVRYRVDSCGKFVFVSREADGSSLDDFLGEFAPLLRDLGHHIGKETHYGVISHTANWKLLVENVLECYHCSTVHSDTFVAGLGIGSKPITDVKVAGAHSSSHFPRVPTRRETLRRKIMSHLDSREFIHDSFFHIHIFPNFFISSTEGTAFYVGHALPVSPTETSLRIRLFEPNVAFTDAGRLRQDALNTHGIALSIQVIEEDRAILETTQRGLTIANRPAVLGPEEVRILPFHKAYCERMTAHDSARTDRAFSVHPAEVA